MAAGDAKSRMTRKRFSDKSSIEEIEQRFDNDVERFSDLETGQSATMDAPLAMELITEAAVAASSPIRSVLDIGCGLGGVDIHLVRHHGVVKVTGVDVEQWTTLVEMIRENPNKMMSFVILRDGAEEMVTVVPQSRKTKDGEQGYIGAYQHLPDEIRQMLINARHLELE